MVILVAPAKSALAKPAHVVLHLNPFAHAVIRATVVLVTAKNRPSRRNAGRLHLAPADRFYHFL